MDFKDLLDKYKYGHATAEEIKIVEEELNKHEVIEEYLSEKYDIGLEKDISQGSNNPETEFVKNSVNKKLHRVVLSSVSIMLLILFVIFYVVSPIVDEFYYNPSQKTVGKHFQNFEFDIRAFTELNLPGYAISGICHSERLGFGAYNLYFGRKNLFTGEEKDIRAKIERDMKIGNFNDFFAQHYFELENIRNPILEEHGYIKNRTDRTISHIKELNSVSYISAYVVFEDDLTMKEFDELVKKYNGKINFKWVGIRTEDEGKPVNNLSGFNPNVNDYPDMSDSADKNKYPYLQLIDWLRQKHNPNFYDMTEAYTKHYTSLLKYMSDRQKAVNALDFGSNKLNYYKSALKYVEKNGVNTYGVLVYAEARELLKFVDNEKVKSIEMDDVLPSVKHIY